MSTARTNFEFRVECETQWGECVVLTGNFPEVGNWQPEQGVRLTTSPETYPVWTTTISLPRVSADLQYKYVIVNNDAGVDCSYYPVWEERHTNRTAKPSGRNLSINDGLFGGERKGTSPLVSVPPLGLTLLAPVDTEPKETPPHYAVPSRELDQISLERSDEVILVSHTLPLCPRKLEDGSWDFDWDESRLLTMLRCLQGRVSVKWVGYPGILVEGVEEQKRISAKLLRDFNCVPVFLTTTQADAFFNRFCHNVLWPLMHNIVDLSGSLFTFSYDDWVLYCRVNQIFSSVIRSILTSSIVWINDYHLMMLPHCLRNCARIRTMSLFFFTPFPSSHVFQLLPVRTELLSSILVVNLVGFLQFDNARNFFNCCSQLLGLDFESRRGGVLCVNNQGRHVMVRCGHVGIDHDKLTVLSDSDEVRRLAAEYRARFGKDTTIIVGNDFRDRLKGLKHKMLAFEQLLQQYERWRTGVKLVQVITNRPNISVDTLLQTEVDQLCDRINEQFPGSVVLLEGPISRAQRVALFRISRVFLNTSFREGLDLGVLEFVHSTKNSYGSVVSSEFVGSGRILSISSTINPWAVDSVVSELDNVLSMNESERKHQWNKLAKYLRSRSIEQWAESFLLDMKRAQREAKVVTYMGLGLGVGREVDFSSDKLSHLNNLSVEVSYRKAVSRLFIFDHSSLPLNRAGSISADAVICLNGLAKDERNVVYILSDRSMEDVRALMMGDLQNVGFTSEFGFLYKQPLSEKWHRLLPSSTSIEWHERAKKVMEPYVERTDGARLEVQRGAVIWHYNGADPRFGGWQAQNLKMQLKTALRYDDVNVVLSSGSVSVTPAALSNGVVVSRVLHHLRKARSEPDFVLCLGTDRRAEDMFATLGQEIREDHVRLYTCIVGRRPTTAGFYLHDETEVLKLLQTLHRHSLVANRSLGDLRAFSVQMGSLVMGPPVRKSRSPGPTFETLSRNNGRG